ncbi:MAG TPA: STAS domain-containing protein [Anaerolineales bacterium]|jgi:anti-anti-sigma regulatory factor|nr:STAS domain-containing protein [Anaerolineales bacterium]
MQISVEQVQGEEPVTIMALRGDLDHSSFEAVIDRAKDLYQAGTRKLLLDMSDLNFMSSSGIVALHSILLLFRGEMPPDPGSGWEALHAIDRARGSGLQANVRILKPQPKVALTLTKSGMTEFFEIYDDLQTALASF